MQKKGIILSLILILFLSVVGLSACEKNGNKPYYGTYTGGLNGNKTVEINKTIKNGNYEYNYEVYDDYFLLTDISDNDMLTLYRFNNGNVLSFGIIYNFHSGSINVRDGYFTTNLIMFKSNMNINYFYSFNNDGTFQYYMESAPLYSYSGKYTYNNGVLKLTGEMAGETVREIYYVESPSRLHFGVYVKDELINDGNKQEIINNNQDIIIDNDSQDISNFDFVGNYSEYYESYVWTITNYKGNEKHVIIPSRVGSTTHDSGPVIGIGNSFNKNHIIRVVIIPNTIQGIGSSFLWCESLNYVNISDSIQDISNSFYRCDSLNEINLGTGIKKIHHSFYRCKNLVDINILSDSCTIYASFYLCEQLKNIVLGTNILEITGNSFSDCSNLETVKIENPNCMIDNESFANCLQLKTVYVNSANIINTVNLHIFDYAETVYIGKDIEITNTMFSFGFEKESEQIYTDDGIDYYKYVIKGE